MKRAFTVYYDETKKFPIKAGDRPPFPKEYPLATIKIEWEPGFGEDIFIKEDVLGDVLEKLEDEYDKVFEKILRYQEKPTQGRQGEKMKKDRGRKKR